MPLLLGVRVQAINKSLSALGDVIQALQQRNPHIPYRNSKVSRPPLRGGGRPRAQRPGALYWSPLPHARLTRPRDLSLDVRS